MLDHHKTAAEHLAGAAAPQLKITLDMERSGATIARDHFAPPGLTDAQKARMPPPCLNIRRHIMRGGQQSCSASPAGLAYSQHSVVLMQTGQNRPSKTCAAFPK